MDWTPTRRGGWVPWSGVAAAVGAALAVGAPRAQTAVLGTRPYVATAFDLVSLVGWLSLLVGVVGAYVTFADRVGALGRASLGTVAVGMGVVAALLGRRAVRFVGGGFRSIPATGEDPAGLLLTVLTVFGLGLAVVGTGGVGLALRRSRDAPVGTAWLLVLAPIVPLVLIGIAVLVDAPGPGRLVVTDVLLVPLGLGWAALGVTVWSRGRHR